MLPEIAKIAFLPVYFIWFLLRQRKQEPYCVTPYSRLLATKLYEISGIIVNKIPNFYFPIPN